MGRETDTRDEILRLASRLLQEKGFNGFSYAHLAESLGIKPAAVHYHFPAKADLGVELIRRFRTRYELWMEDTQDYTPTKKLAGFFSIYRRFLTDGKVCPGGVMLAEMKAIPEEMHKEIRLMMASVHRWLAAMLEEGREKGELHFEGTAEGKAAVILGAVQGALQTSRVLGAEHFEAAVAQIEEDLADQKLKKGVRRVRA